MKRYNVLLKSGESIEVSGEVTLFDESSPRPIPLKDNEQLNLFNSREVVSIQEVKRPEPIMINIDSQIDYRKIAKEINRLIGQGAYIPPVSNKF